MSVVRSLLRIAARGVAAALLAGTMLARGSVPAQTPEVPPGAWHALPDTRLDQAKRGDGTPMLPQALPGGTESGIAGVYAYSGGALDATRGRIMIVRTGGHVDWAGNQVVAFDIPTKKWLLLQDYSKDYPRYRGAPCRKGSDGAYADPPVPKGCSRATEPAAAVYKDGSPASLHTYGNQAHMPTVDAVLSAGGLRWWDAEPANATWWWKPEKGWESKPSRRPGGYTGVMIWDGDAKVVWYRSSQQFAAYDPAADAWKMYFTGPAGRDHSESSAFALDPAGHKLYRFTRKTGPPWGLQVLDLKSPSTPETTLATTGDTQVESVTGAGLIWDADLPGLVAFGKSADGQRGAIYTLDVAQNPAAWKRDEVSESAAAPPVPSPSGTWGRFVRYEGRYYVTMSPRQDVWVYTPAWKVAPTPTPRARARGLYAPATRVALAADASPKAAPGTSVPPAMAAPTSGPLPANTWVTVPQPPPGKAPLARSGKHARATYDTKRGRLLITGGDRDGSDAGNASVWSVNLADGTAEELSPMCRPAPELMPNFPDNVVWAYDSRRDQAVLLRGFFFGLSRGQAVCKRDDPNIVRTDLLFDLASRTWQPPPWPVSPLGLGSDSGGPTFGVYDEATDHVYAYKWDGAWGGNMLILNRANNSWERIRFGESPRDGPVRNAYCVRSQMALEPGKAIYMSCISNKKPMLVRFDLAKKSATGLEMPEGYVAPPTDQETYMVFDPRARVLLHPFVPNLAGVVSTLYVYDLDAKGWSARPVPTDQSPRVFGNLAAWDPESGALVLYGGHGTTIGEGVRLVPGPVTWRYRYVKE